MQKASQRRRSKRTSRIFSNDAWMEKIAAIIAGGGRGERFSSKFKKQFFKVKGKPLFAHSIHPFQRCKRITEIILVVPKEDLKEAARMIKAFGLSKVTSVVRGGQKRQDSVYNGLKSLKTKPKYVLVHDAVRPFVKISEIEKALGEVRRCKALIFATPAKNTIKTVSGKKVSRTIMREKLWEAHTPQIFDFGLLMRAYKKAYREGFYGTDDAELTERLGAKVQVFPCAAENIKITNPADRKFLEAIMKDWRW